MKWTPLKIYALKLALFTTVLGYMALDLLVFHGPVHHAIYSPLSGAPTIAIYDNRTKQGALLGPRSVNLISPSTIDLVTVDMVWAELQKHLGN